MAEDVQPTISRHRVRKERTGALATLAIGARIGKYEIRAVLGQGGFGITYQARDTQLDRDVAVKEYLPTAFAVRDPDSMVLPRSTQVAEDFRWGRARFLAEAKTLARFERAAGIVNVYDFLEANGTAYMVMGLVAGETLEGRLRRDGRLSQAAIEQLLHPLLDGLEQVHAADFLHRDIKPANILIDDKGQPTLIDFGASRAALQGRTQALTAVYTPGYAAFEQFTSARQGPWTDIYGLGATLYHCVAGTLPPSAIERQQDDALVPAVEAGKGRYAPRLLAAIDAALRLKAADRPQSIAQWRSIFSGAGSGSAAPGEVDDDLPTRRVASVAVPRRRFAVAWTLAGGAVLSLAAGAAWILVQPAPETPGQALRRIEEDVRRQTERANKMRQDQEAAARPPAGEEASRKAAEEKAAADGVARRQAEEDERQRIAAEAARRAEAESARKAAEEKAAAEAEARRQAEEDERQRIAAEAARQAEAESARKAAEKEAAADAVARRQAEEAERQRAAAEAARNAEGEAARKAAEEKAADAARRRAEEAEREARIRRATEEREREATAARQREVEQQRAAEEKRQAELAARERADTEARRKAEDDARRQAEAAEAALRLSPDDRKRLQVALTALGHDTQGHDGVVGQRTRAMVARWQKSQGQPETGFLTGSQWAALRQQGAAAIARFDEAEKRAEEERRRAEDDARRREEEARRRPPPGTTASAPPAAAPSPAGSHDGRWTGRLRCDQLIGEQAVTVGISNGQGTYRQSPTELQVSIRGDVARVIVESMTERGFTVYGDLSGRIAGAAVEATGRIRAAAAGMTGLVNCTLRLSRQ